MSNLIAVAQWHDAINKVDVTEPIVGGDGGNANLATRQLAENTFYLEQERRKHMSAENPHEQYVLLSDYQSKIGELISRINMISSGLTNNNSGGEYLLASIDLYAISETLSRYATRTRETRVDAHQGYEFPNYTKMQDVNVTQNTSVSRTYDFLVTLPTEYDPDAHRVVATGGSSYQLVGRQVVFKLQTDIVRYQVNLSADKGEETRYHVNIRANMRVELFSKAPPKPVSGILVGLLDVTYSDTVISQNDFSGAGVVKVNEESGYTFGYPTALQLPKPIGNAPRAYNHITTILLPIEYDSAIHRLSVVNSSGTYEIKEAEKSVVFSSAVSSVNQGDSETKDTLNTTLRISMYNK